MDHHFGLLADPVSDAHASLVTGRCPACDHDEVVPRDKRDPLQLRLLRRPKRPTACSGCGCRHVFHAFTPGFAG